jgi:hypothetical protein
MAVQAPYEGKFVMGYVMRAEVGCSAFCWHVHAYLNI